MKNKCLVCNSSFSAFRILKTISIGIGTGNIPCIYLLLDQYQNVNLVGLKQMHFRSKDMTLKESQNIQFSSNDICRRIFLLSANATVVPRYLIKPVNPTLRSYTDTCGYKVYNAFNYFHVFHEYLVVSVSHFIMNTNFAHC